jgi:hypothetical protein
MLKLDVIVSKNASSAYQDKMFVIWNNPMIAGMECWQFTQVQLSEASRSFNNSLQICGSIQT